MILILYKKNLFFVPCVSGSIKIYFVKKVPEFKRAN